MMQTQSKSQMAPVRWMGEIPATWQTIRFSNAFSERREKVSDRDFSPLSVSKAGIVPQLADVAKTDNGDNRKLVRVGDFVINSRSDRKGSSGVSQYEGSVSLINIVLKPKAVWYSPYLHYLLRSQPFQEEFYRNGHGIVADLWTTRRCDISHSLLPSPPMNMQMRIAAFLESKSKEIDVLVERREKVIAHLQELKQAIIAHAVTKGLDPDTPTKDSGVSWLGQVPTHWQVMPSRFLFRESKEIRKPGDEKLAATQQFGVIPQTEYMERMKSRIVTATQDLDKWKHVEAGNFVISLRSFQGGLELCKMAGCVTWHYIVLSGKLPQINLSYFKWLFKSRPYILQLQSTCNFIRDGQDLRYSNFKKVPLPLMGVEEQAEIAAYLDTKCAAIDELVARHRAMIERLKELKTSLIAAAVTGKIDVR